MGNKVVKGQIYKSLIRLNPSEVEVIKVTDSKVWYYYIDSLPEGEEASGPILSTKNFDSFNQESTQCQFKLVG